MPDLSDPLPPVALAVAPNGGRRTKADHPDLPMTLDEVARTAAECLEAGAAMMHVHVRGPDGAHLLDADGYHEVTRIVRAAVGDRLVLQITSEALGRYGPTEQMAVVRAVRPEAVSMALRELAPGPDDEIAFADLLRWMAGERIVPQIILYAADDVARLGAMRRRGLLPWPEIPVLYVLGRYVPGQRSIPADLLPFLNEERFGEWMVCAFGRHEMACMAAAAALGGHCRVGFENNVFRPDGGVASSNAALIALNARAMAGMGKPLLDGPGLRQRWATLLAH